MMHVHRGPIKCFLQGIYDGPHATPPEATEGPVFLGIKNVTPDGRIDLSEIRHVSEQDFPKWTRRVLPQEHDIVFSYEATLHRYALIPNGFRGCLGRRMALMRTNRTMVDPCFLHYYFLTPSWKAKVEAIVINGATVDRIPLTKFPELELILPTLPEQERIASILNAYDHLIENNRQRIQLLEQAARLLYKEWFFHLRFPGHERVKIIDGVPEGWEKGRVSDLGQVITGKTPSTKDETNFGGGIPFVKTPDMHGQILVVKTGQTLSERGANIQPKKFIPKGSVMVSCIGTVGVVSISSCLCQTNQQINSVVFNKPVARYYSCFALKGLKPRLEGMGGGATMGNTNKTKFNALSILIPDIKILTSFHDTVEPVFSQIETLTRYNEMLSQARDLLLPRLMSGEIIV